MANTGEIHGEERGEEDVPAASAKRNDTRVATGAWIMWAPHHGRGLELSANSTLKPGRAYIESDNPPAVGSSIHVFLVEGGGLSSVATVAAHRDHGFEAEFGTPIHPTFVRAMDFVLSQSDLRSHRRADKALFRLLFLFEKLIWRTAKGSAAFFDANDFPWTKPLEDGWLSIRQELEVVLQNGYSPNVQDLSKRDEFISYDDKWQAFALIVCGKEVKENTAHCPNTIKLLSALPDLQTAYFSIHQPRKYIPPHRGPYKGLLRGHLALIVPSPENACRIRVGYDIRTWQEGKVMVFDDTIEHEVWNDSNEIRVVLFMDFTRPLPFPLSLVNRAILGLMENSPFARDAQEGAARQAKQRMNL